jgi:hypothetical protein
MAAVTLSCQPNKVGNVLTFAYKVENRGNNVIYFMDAMPGHDPLTRKPRADEQAVVVMLAPGDDAIIGKFVALLPTDRRIAMPAVPLARRLGPGAAYEGALKIPMPLAEISPYFGDLTLRQYEVVDIKGAIFRIGYWTEGVDGLASLPVEYAPGLFQVVTRNTAQSATHVSQRFPVTGLQLFKRTDAFPRGAAPPPPLKPPAPIIEEDKDVTRIKPSGARPR